MIINKFNNYIKESSNQKTYFDKWESIIIELKSIEEIDYAFDYINKNISKYLTTTPTFKDEVIDYLNQGEYPYIRYIHNNKSFKYGTIDYLLANPMYHVHEKNFNIDDLPYIKNLIKSGGIIKPSYKPKRFLYEDILLEKSSLTKLGIPREVMQPIQRDLALSPDAEWEKITHKKEVINYLRNDDKNLFVQIAVDSIKIIVSYPSIKGTIYFIDNYIYRDTDWTGEFEKLKRVYDTLTQTAINIDPQTNIYRLVGDFSINKQAKRKMIKKEKSFIDFSEKFKTDFLKHFDKILKRITGTNFKTAKEKVTDKAKKIAVENSLLIRGLDNPLNGPNGLSILDEFLYQFEEEYSNYFEERIDIQELSKYFTLEKVMTMFMYYIYTGKILIN